MGCTRRRRWKCLARECDMKHADDPESSNARTWVEWPLGDVTKTLHVMRRELEPAFVAVFDVTDWLVTGLVLLLTGSSLGLTCSKVWWGLWHSWHLWRDLHCFTKCPGRRQFIQRSLARTAAIMSSWGRDLNLLHEWSGWKLVLQMMQESAAVMCAVCVGADLLTNYLHSSSWTFLVPSVAVCSEACAWRLMNSSNLS